MTVKEQHLIVMQIQHIQFRQAVQAADFMNSAKYKEKCDT